MVFTRKISPELKKKVGLFFAILSLVTYILLVITFYVFMSTMLLIALFVVVPLIIIAIIHKNKNLLKRRAKAVCWALGLFILILLPAFWLIPQQIYVRVNRMNELITPQAQKVKDFAAEFLAENPGYDSLSFEEKANLATNFTMREIVWALDYKNYGLSGHVATPTQCIDLGSDDCQGQAVTLASLLLNLGFPYVWVTETPFHWYVLVRNPALGELQEGWEVNVELYQENGEVMPLNRDGEGNMPDWRLEEVVLIFNANEILFPVNFFQALLIGWSATAFFYDDFFPIFMTLEIIIVFMAMLVLAIPIMGWTSYMASFKGEKRERRTDQRIPKFILRIILIGTLLFWVFLIWFFLQLPLWDWTLLLSISEISLICILASEPKFWRIFRLD